MSNTVTTLPEYFKTECHYYKNLTADKVLISVFEGALWGTNISINDYSIVEGDQITPITREEYETEYEKALNILKQ